MGHASKPGGASHLRGADARRPPCGPAASRLAIQARAYHGARGSCHTGAACGACRQVTPGAGCPGAGRTSPLHMAVRKREFAHQKVPVDQEGDSGVQKPVAIGGSKAIPWRIVTAATGASLLRVPLGWGRRDQMDRREIGAHPPGITGQEGQLRNQGMGSNEKVRKR
jgi:hypothetical protein